MSTLSTCFSGPRGTTALMRAAFVACASLLVPAGSVCAAGQAPATDSAQKAAQGSAAASEPSAYKDPHAGEMTEEQLRQMLVGKTLYLRSGYLDNALSFDEHGKLTGHSPQGSYTLSLVEIDKVHLSKHKVELTGARYGLHFLGALPNEDPTKAVDRVRITPKKKVLKITVDRELVVTPKKKKDKKDEGAPGGKAKADAKAEAGATAEADATAANAAGAPKTDEADQSDAAAAKAEMDAAPEAKQPADAGSVTTTTSPAHATEVLKGALGKIFAEGLDQRMIEAMPSFWRLYYQAAAAQRDYSPTDAGVFRLRDVDQKARLLSAFEPPSNEYAQANGVAGMAMYHAIIGADGKPQEIVVGRPIGFGLDENAADTIRKASFAPAMKDGKPVPVMLDLVVQFRIYSKRTDQAAKPEAEEATSAPKLPGPYSATHP